MGKSAKKHILTRQEFVVSEVNGEQRVVVPKEVFAGAKPLWEDFLIGKFLNASAPHVGKIYMIVNKIWRLGDKSSLIDVFAVNDSTVKFRIRNEAMRARILNRGMWNIMSLPMMLSKWTPFAEEAQPAMKSIPLWVTLKNIPPSMFTDKGIEFLASAVGKPKKLHPKTEACVSFEEAQILVEADLTKKLPTEYHLTGEEEGELDVVVEYLYPWLPPRCSNCKKWGHGNDTCLAEVGGETRISSQCSSLGKRKDVETEKVDKSIISATVAEENENTTPTIDGQIADTDTVEIAQGISQEAAKDDVWITPLKPGRSPGKQNENLRYGEVSILSNSYAALLGKEGEEEGETEEVEQKEDHNALESKTAGTENIMVTNGNKHKNRKAKTELPPRQPLPRNSKNSQSFSLSTKVLPREQSAKPPLH